MKRGTWNMGLRATLAALATAMGPAAAVAQAQPSIAVDGTLPGVTAQDLSGPDYVVTPDLGSVDGANQFHSFSRFSVLQGEQVTFADNPGIERIISRVTGEDGSFINGPVISETAGADFYFLNPNGLVFGENASLDIKGDVVFSTAELLELSDGGRFDVVNPASDALTSAPVAAFGFLSNDPASIAIQGAGLSTRFRSPLSDQVGYDIALIGGDLFIEGQGSSVAFLESRGGRVDLASLDSPGRVTFVEADGAVEADLIVEAERLGNIRIGDEATVSSGGPPVASRVCLPAAGCLVANGAGDIFVRGHDLRLEDGDLRALTVTDRDAGRIDVQLSGDLIVRGSAGSGESGIFGVSGEELVLSDDGFFQFVDRIDTLPEGPYEIFYERSFDFGTGQTGPVTSVRYPGTGRAADIRVSARNLRLENGGRISSQSEFGGGAGAITLDIANAIDVQASDDGALATRSQITSSARSGGEGGNIEIRAQDLRLANGAAILSEVRGGGGTGGKIDIDVARLSVVGGSEIDTSTRGTGNGGSIDIVATESVGLFGANDARPSGITTFSQPEATGAAGNITVTAPLIALHSGAQIATDARVQGDAGTIDLRSPEIRLVGSRIAALSEGGEGGNVYVNGGPLGRALDGSLTIETPPEVSPGQQLVLQDSEISTSVLGGSGVGGDIAIDARFVVLDGSNILAQAELGDGGNIRIVAESLVADPSSVISASSAAAADGVVEILSPSLDVRGESPELPGGIIDAAALLRDRCAARSGGAAASFVVSGPVGVPASPEGFLPAPTRVAHGAGDSSLQLARIVQEDEGNVALRTRCSG